MVASTCARSSGSAPQPRHGPRDRDGDESTCSGQVPLTTPLSRCQIVRRVTEFCLQTTSEGSDHLACELKEAVSSTDEEGLR